MYETTEDLLALFRRHLGENFNLRTGQEAVIRTIWNHYKKHPNGTVVLEAPTGTGKSVIGYCLAILLREDYQRGYIIASDLSLFDQYQNDIFRLGLDYGAVKGIDNYNCDVNGFPFSLGVCRIKNMTHAKAMELVCYENCGYYQARKKASKSDVAVMTYSYWLIMMNYILENNPEGALFDQRNFTIFDECHKINEIVQSHFGPLLSENDEMRLRILDKFLSERLLFNIKIDVKKFTNFYLSLRNTDDKNSMFKIMLQMENYLKPIIKWGNDYKDSVSSSFNGEDVPKEIMQIFKVLEWVKDIHCKLEDYNHIHVDNPSAIVKVQSDDQLKFYTTEESSLVKKHLLDRSGFKILMSATVGDPRSFAKIIGTPQCLFIQMPSIFDYKNSPIHILKKYRMGYKEKNISMPNVIEIMDRILDIHKNERGIIHSGSYDINKNVLLNSRNKDRLFSYTESKEKGNALNGLSVSLNGVIIGPSLIEGLNLENDLSRFQIILKVPYPHLQDELVQARMETNPEWYTWKTSLAVLQAIGRSVRNPEDFATTYILDACFLDLLKKVNFPKWFTNRIKIM